MGIWGIGEQSGREMGTQQSHRGWNGVMYIVGAVRLCPKGDPKGLGCSTPKGSERSITW